MERFRRPHPPRSENPDLGTRLPSRQGDVLLTEPDSIACGSQLGSLPGTTSVAAKTNDLYFACNSLAMRTAIFTFVSRRTATGSIRAFLWMIHKPPSCLCSEPFVPRTRTYDAKIKRRDCSRGTPFFRRVAQAPIPANNPNLGAPGPRSPRTGLRPWGGDPDFRTWEGSHSPTTSLDGPYRESVS